MLIGKNVDSTVLATTLLVAACDARSTVAKGCESPSPTVSGSVVHADSVGLKTDAYPFPAGTLRRYHKNPVVTGSDVSKDHTLAADPHLLVMNDRLYLFFEALRPLRSPTDACCGEIWMAESSDGFAWSRFSQVSTRPVHFSHPQAFIHEGRAHVFYNHNNDGSIYYRSSALDSFPAWTEETAVFKGPSHGWHHLVEFSILEHGGLWYLLGISGNGSVNDQWIRGRWARDFPADWNAESHEITPCPLLDVKDHDWLKGIVEITSLQVDSGLFLLMGAAHRKSGKRAISTFAVSHLSPKKLEGLWVTDGHTFPLSPSGWDDTDIHRAHAVQFKDRWVYVYDGRKGQEWKIGVATAPLRNN